jgi:cytochrome c oxidase cbb3-type subunit 2
MTIFTDQGCVACHGDTGQGGAGPSLAGNTFLSDTQRVVSQIIGGGGDMPPFGDVLTDQQIAAVATYIRGAWGNSFSPVTAEEVAAQRAAGAPAAPAAPAP